MGSYNEWEVVVVVTNTNTISIEDSALLLSPLDITLAVLATDASSFPPSSLSTISRRF